MAGLVRRKAGAKNKQIRKSNRTKRYRKDMDTVVLVDMLPKNTEALLNQEEDETKPALGQVYCVNCARYF